LHATILKQSAKRRLVLTSGGATGKKGT